MVLVDFKDSSLYASFSKCLVVWLLTPLTIFGISGILFGLAHIFGMPSGIIGISLAAILGFVLAKSVFEIQGFFWAWLIHFLQDVVIIGSLYLMDKS